MNNLGYTEITINDQTLLKTFSDLFSQDDKIDSALFTDLLLIINKHKNRLNNLNTSGLNNTKLEYLDQFLEIVLKNDFNTDLKIEKFLLKHA